MESKDGTISGKMHYNYPGGKDNGQARVVGLKVDGNKAKLEFLYNAGPWAGYYGFVVVIDNGEGGKSQPDANTAVWIYTGEEHPNLTELRQMNPDGFIAFMQSLGLPFYQPQEIDAGNIQVR